MADVIYRGDYGYVRAEVLTHEGKRGALVYYAHPDPRKLHIVDLDGMNELVAAVDTVAATSGLAFCIFYGAYDQVHAGADITQFAGTPDYDTIRDHLYRGVKLDTLIKQMSQRLRSVAIFCGDRYGGSVEWPLFATWAVADDKTRIQFSEVQLGILPGWNGMLNAVLRTHPVNVRYMGQTGNPITAQQMQQIGLAQTVVATPPYPDRRRVAPEEWGQVWADHAAASLKLLLDAALELACSSTPLPHRSSFRVCTDEELGEEVRHRTDFARYRALKARAQQEADRLDPATQPDEWKALNREMAGELARMGKPLAPRSIAAVSQFVQRWSALSQDDVLKNFDEAGHAEADLCLELMHTEHRRIGVDAVLGKHPAERIPVFT